MQRALGSAAPSWHYWRVAAALILGKHLNLTDDGRATLTEGKLLRPAHERPGLQTVQEFDEVAIHPDAEHRTLYLLPLKGEEVVGKSTYETMQVEVLQGFIQAFFQIECKLLQPVDAAIYANISERLHHQYPTYREKDAIEVTSELEGRVPEDALGVIAVIPYCLFLDVYERERTERCISERVPLVLVSLAERCENAHDMLLAIVRAVADLLGIQTPCRWFRGCAMNGLDPVFGKPDRFNPIQQENWMQKHTFLAGKDPPFPDHFPAPAKRHWENLDKAEEPEDIRSPSSRQLKEQETMAGEVDKSREAPARGSGGLEISGSIYENNKLVFCPVCHEKLTLLRSSLAKPASLEMTSSKSATFASLSKNLTNLYKFFQPVAKKFSHDIRALNSLRQAYKRGAEEGGSGDEQMFKEAGTSYQSTGVYNKFEQIYEAEEDAAEAGVAAGTPGLGDATSVGAPSTFEEFLAN